MNCLNSLSLALAGCLLLGVAAQGQTHSKRDPEHFFKPPTALKELPEDVLYPHGRQFLLGFYSIGGGTPEKTDALFPDDIVQKTLAQYRSMGVRFLGPQYELNGRILADAEKHGYDVIYTISLPMDFHGKQPLELTPEEIKSRISEQVKAVAGNKRIKVWYLAPEELRHWIKREVAYARAATEAIREADPLHRPVFIYDPAHRPASALKWIAEQMDYLAKGTYTNYAKMRDQRIWVRWSIEQENEAFKLAGKEGVSLLLPEMFQEPPPEDAEKIPSWVRHDVYLGLVSGAKGILVFSARQRPKFPSWERYREAYARVIGELTGEMNLSQVFLFGERRSDITVDVIDGPAEVELLFPAGGIKEPLRYPSANFLDVAYGPDRYLFVVNSSNQPLRAMVGGLSFASAQVHNLFEKETPFVVGEGEFEIELKPLEVKAYRFTRVK